MEKKLFIKKPPQNSKLTTLSSLVGEFIKYWGFKEVHGRIWVHLYLSKKPLSAKDLMQRLKISKPLVSISIQELLNYQVIQKVGTEFYGTTVYQANPDLFGIIRNVLRSREKVLLAKTRTASLTLSELSQEEQESLGLDREKIVMLQAFVAFGDEFLNKILT